MSQSSQSPIPPTPLSTRELRDKYARKALHTDSPSQTLLAESVVRRRSPRKKADNDGGGKGIDSADGDMAGNLSSPPNQKFKESSPRYDPDSLHSSYKFKIIFSSLLFSDRTC